jgi:EPS-associated MarR family transcriptional regulator
VVVAKLRSVDERVHDLNVLNIIKINMLTDEYRYKILKILEANPEISQRDLARELDISLGRANFCLKALIEKGLLKATNFKNSQNKLAYMYLLTPRGIEEKSKITAEFLKVKLQEYATLENEIAALREESKLLEKQRSAA